MLLCGCLFYTIKYNKIPSIVKGRYKINLENVVPWLLQAWPEYPILGIKDIGCMPSTIPTLYTGQSIIENDFQKDAPLFEACVGSFLEWF